MTLPEHLGGAGIGFEPGLRADLLPILKEVGRGNLALGRIFEGHVNALILLQAFGAPHQLAQAARDVREGRVFGVWNTGPPCSPRLAPREDGTFLLSGAKTFATAAARIQRALVTAALPEGGWQMCIVPLDTQGMTVDRNTWSPLGMEASESFTIRFSDVPLQPGALIGIPGDYYAEPVFTAGAFRYCAVHLGGAQALFDRCAQFIRTLGRENDPFHLQRMGQMAVLLESGRQWIAQAGAWLEAEPAGRELLAVRAQMMRIATEEICTRIIHLVQLSAGARGLAEAEPLSQTMRDLQMYLRQAGFDHAFQIVGRHAMNVTAPLS